MNQENLPLFDEPRLNAVIEREAIRGLRDLDYSDAEIRVLIVDSVFPDDRVERLVSLLEQSREMKVRVLSGSMIALAGGLLPREFSESRFQTKFERGLKAALGELNMATAITEPRFAETVDQSPKAVAEKRRRSILGKRGRW